MKEMLITEASRLKEDDQTPQRVWAILERDKQSLHLKLTNMAECKHENSLRLTQTKPCSIILKCINWETE